MSRIITKTVTVVAVAALAFLSLFSIQDAEAQNGYAPAPGFLDLILIEPQDFSATDPINCGGQPYGVISGGVAPYTVSYNLTGTASIGLGSIVVPVQGNFVAPAGTIELLDDPRRPVHRELQRP